MRLEIIRTEEEFRRLEGEWNHLLGQGASHVPFLRHEYLSAWWQTLGGGEWSQGELYIVTARRTDRVIPGEAGDGAGELAGIAPLFLSTNPAGERALMLLGSIEISDYLDVIAAPEDLPAFIDLLLEHLCGDQAPAWQVLDLYNLLEGSPTLKAVEDAAARCGLMAQRAKLQHCPYIPLPGDWETYLAGIDKKQRHEIRRKMRRAESADLPVRWYVVVDGADLEADIDAFIGLMGQDAEKLAFLSDAMRSQIHLSIAAAQRAGWLQLAFLEIDGVKAAGYLNFDYDNRIWVYNSGIDYNLSAYSPGWVLLGYLLQWAIENGREAFDFMRGDEDYKYRFGGVDRFIYRMTVRR